PDAGAALHHLGDELGDGVGLAGVLLRDFLVRGADHLLIDLVAGEAVLLLRQVGIRPRGGGNHASGHDRDDVQGLHARSGGRGDGPLGYHQDNGRARPELTRGRIRAPEVHMLFVLIGVVLIVLNLLDIGVVGTWNWQVTGDLWKFFFPFLLASLWWIW